MCLSVVSLSPTLAMKPALKKEKGKERKERKTCILSYNSIITALVYFPVDSLYRQEAPALSLAVSIHTSRGSGPAALFPSKGTRVLSGHLASSPGDVLCLPPPPLLPPGPPASAGGQLVASL